ncbi:MAG: hypothetical protein M1495_16440 [Bacteroidetes bacterium]|nr:hypothetical protein [Bacteroidota bacterium]
MTIYGYNLFAKILYRYGNIPITFFLLIYLIESVVQLPQHWYAIFFVLINLAIIISLNKYYAKTYKLFPFKISADNEKMICSNFFLRKKSVEIRLINIDKISGGIFSGYPSRAIYLHDSVSDETIGIYTHSAGYKNLLKLILKNIPQTLYDDLLEKMKREKKN